MLKREGHRDSNCLGSVDTSYNDHEKEDSWVMRNKELIIYFIVWLHMMKAQAYNQS